jgi:hypothetical protein
MKIQTDYLPYSLLQEGISVLIDKTNIIHESEYWVEFKEHHTAYCTGIVDQPNDIIHHREIKFTLDEILTVQGSMEWNIEHLYVSCSKEVFDGVPIGYFRNKVTVAPFYYGWFFYSVNEIDKIKHKIETVEISLKDLLGLDRAPEPYLELFGYCGFLRNTSGGFDELTDEDIIHKDRNV